MPPKYLIKKNEQNKNLYFPLYRIILPEFKKYVDDDKNLKNTTFKDTIFLIDDIMKDGNCFYRAINNYICWAQKYQLFFRSLLFDYLTSNYNKIIEENPYIYYIDKYLKTENYIPLIIKNGTYAGDFECMKITKILIINILVLRININDNNKY